MGVRTLTRKGMPFDVLRDMSKGTFMRICEDMERFAGPGNKFEPLPTKGIRWAEWPGQAPGVFGSKEIRFLPHKRGPREYVLFLRVSLTFFHVSIGFHAIWQVEPNARELWREDESLAMEKGKYDTQFAAYGAAPCWRRYEVALVRQAMVVNGVAACQTQHVCPLRYTARQARNG